MKCPYCNDPDTKVIDKRDTEDMAVTRRRRECLKCGKRFTTYERLEQINLVVVKKDGKRELFDRSKIKLGMLKACEKTSVSEDQIEKAVEQIETALKNKDTTEIDSTTIGELVMKKLKKLWHLKKVRHIVSGGSRRQDSVLNALRHIGQTGGCLIIHDGVRPFVTGALIRAAATMAAENGAALVAVRSLLELLSKSRSSGERRGGKRLIHIRKDDGNIGYDVGQQ